MAMSPAMLALVKGAKNKFSKSAGKAFKPKEGKTTIRILPAQVEGAVEGQFWFEYGVHWIKADSNSKPLAVVGCHHVTFDATCPVCTAIEKAKASAVSDEDVKVIKDWNAKKTVLVNVLVRSGSDANEDTPVVMELTPSTFGFIMGLMEEYAADFGDITDPNTGMDLMIERSGKGLDTEYKVMPKPGAKPVAKGVMDKCIDLRAYVEKEFFRGEETKALTHISNLTGVSVTGIAAPRSTALLTSARVEDAHVTSEPKVSPAEKAEVEKIADAIVEEDPPFVPNPPKTPTLAAEAEDDEEAALLAALAKKRAEKAAAKAAEAPKPAPKAPVAPAAADPTALDAAEVDSILAELDNL